VRRVRSQASLVGFVFALALAATAIGCGGSSSGKHDGGGVDAADADGSSDGTGSCVAEEPAGGVASWIDDGVSRCALIIEPTHMTATSSDNFQLIAIDPGSVVITLVVSTYGNALLGSYDCTPDGGAVLEDGGASDYVSFEYVGGAGAYTTQSCSITITAPGSPDQNARGSFSAILAPLGGGPTKTISSGVFDTPVSLTGG
jgi:hypothetical protein